MEDLKEFFAKNLIKLRKEMKLTQAELAEKINYSDKAVSKWERGESIPDVAVLKSVADLFGVTVDYLIASHEVKAEPIEEPMEAPMEEPMGAPLAGERVKKKNGIFIALFSAVAVVAIVVFLIIALK